MFEPHRTHFITARGLLRHHLGRYSGLEPAGIRFNYNPHGKPSVEPSREGDSLYFNVSHSNGMALFAFTRHSDIGVDIEFINDRVDIERIGAMVFSSNELTLLQALLAELRPGVFSNSGPEKKLLSRQKGKGFHCRCSI